MAEPKIIKIITAQDNLQAEMILNTFSDNNIPAYKQDTSPGCFMNLYAGCSFFAEDIYIAEPDAPKAVEILEGMGLL